MFKLFEISNSRRKEIQNIDDVYTVYEFARYQLEYYSDKIVNNTYFIEDEPIRNDFFILINSTTAVTIPYCFFEDYFGFAKISINNEIFQVNILIEKLKVSEVEDIILYLFENNHYILDKFISKSSYKGGNVYDGKEYIFSSKYLNLIEDFCAGFEQLYLSFKNTSYTIIRKKFKVSDYNSQVIDFKSIEWVLQNLDTVFFDNALANHPSSINISNNYGLVDKIGAEQNELSFRTYENEIILGAFSHLQITLNRIRQIINQKLNEVSPREDEIVSSNYSDFRQFKKIPFIRLLNNISKLEKRINDLFLKYSLLFKEAKPRNLYPKLTPVFSKYKHYQKAFNLIRLLRNSEYHLDGEIQLLNIRKLSELYELYNLSVMIEEMQLMFENNTLFEKPTVYSAESDLFISRLCYKKKLSNYSFTLYYEPMIKKTSGDTKLITIGNFGLSVNGNYCKPDYVIEVIENEVVKYCIIDSKYSKIKTVEAKHKMSCIKKYILDIGVEKNPYQKADLLILLHPDSADQENTLIYNESHFPKIVTMISKPKYSKKLRELLRAFSTLSLND